MEEKEIERISRIFERRSKIIRHNNSCIIETISFYENFLLRFIIEPYFFNKSYDEMKELKKFFENRMNIMDRYKIVVEIGRRRGIQNFKKFDNYIKMRNEVAHNLTSITSYDIKSKEGYVIIGGRKITWKKYLSEIKEWAEYSYEMARYIMNVYKSVFDYSNKLIQFHYCKIMGECILVKNSLILPEPNGEYTCFADVGLDSELREYIIEEKKDQDSDYK